MESDVIIPGHISWSQIYQHQCEWRWGLRNVHRYFHPRSYKPPTTGSAIHIGIASGIRNGPDSVHKSLREWVLKEYAELNALDLPDELHDENEDVIEQAAEDAHKVVDKFFRWLDLDEWKTVIAPDGEPIIEKAFSCELPPFQGGFMGVIDWAATHRQTGLTWVIDWKSRLQFRPVEVEETNLQKACYQHLLLEHGIHTDGSRICQIWREPMKKPKLNKNGTMSRAKIRTTWEVYESELLFMDLDPADYIEEMKPKLNTIDDYYRWSEAFRGPVEVESTWKKVIVPRAAAIGASWVKAGDGKELIRSLGMMECDRCWARDMCMELLRGRKWEDAVISSGLVRRAEDIVLSDKDMDEDMDLDSLE